MVKLQGKLLAEELQQAAQVLSVPPEGEGAITLDLSGVTEIDSAGVALLALTARGWLAQGRSTRIVGASDRLQSTLELFPELGPEVPPEPPARIGVFERAGAFGAEAFEILMSYLVLCADTVWFSVAGVLKGGKGIRWRATIFEMSEMGSKALGVVGLISFLVGATMALQSAVQLRQFGANIFVVDLIGISMTRELGPLMAAIVVAGRSGS